MRTQRSRDYFRGFLGISGTRVWADRDFGRPGCGGTTGGNADATGETGRVDFGIRAFFAGRRFLPVLLYVFRVGGVALGAGDERVDFAAFRVGGQDFLMAPHESPRITSAEPSRRIPR